MTYPIEAIVLAAGKGTRMHSQTPKVLHSLAGKPMLQHVLDTAKTLGTSHTILVLGHQAELVQSTLAQWNSAPTTCVRQEPQWGTGHAAMQALPHLSDDGITVILSGDVPLIQADTLMQLVQKCAGTQLALLTVVLEQPTGYGRILRANTTHTPCSDKTSDNPAPVLAIVEEKDATPEQKKIQEVYSGILAVPTHKLKNWLQNIDNRNAQNEYYLTDVVKLALADGVPVQTLCIPDPLQVVGVNSPSQLAELERAWQLRQAQALMEAGIRLADPARIDIRGDLQCAQDVQIDINCIFEGQVTLGQNVRIGPHCVLRNVRVAAGTHIQAFSHIDGACIGEDVRIGPFARLRPGTQLEKNVHIGNFVEVKNSHLHTGAKANHLAYLGDADVGERVNYGAGSITANYDGANKHRTTIEANVHVGSNCVLVAPVHIGADATIGAGSTISKNAAPKSLALTRAKQLGIPNWTRPSKTTKLHQGGAKKETV